MAEVYRYPYKVFTDKTDYLQIDIVRYKSIRDIRNREEEGSTSLSSKARSRNVNQGQEKLETILLPMPSNVSDNNAVKYGESSLNSIAGAVVGGVGGLMETGKVIGEGRGIGAFVDAFKNSASKTLEGTVSAVGGLSGAQGFMTRQLTSSSVSILGANITPDQILARATGEILNPNIELLFDKPTLRSFRFQYKMTPRSATEGEQIKQIIRSFKRNMAPKLGSNQKDLEGLESFLRTPNVFELRYRQGGAEHQYLHRFKQCFLESINVNYTGEGVYSTYEDGTPVSMIMDLTFKEIEPIYDVDQNEAGGVGY